MGLALVVIGHLLVKPLGVGRLQMRLELGKAFGAIGLPDQNLLSGAGTLCNPLKGIYRDCTQGDIGQSLKGYT